MSVCIIIDVIEVYIVLSRLLMIVSRPDFSSHDGTYYNPPVGKPTRNPEQHVMGLRVETKQE